MTLIKVDLFLIIYIAFIFFNSSIVIVGGIIPLFILSKTNFATFSAVFFVLNPSLPGKPGIVV